MSEVLVGVAPCMQPSPAKNPGGDCFACALTAAMRHLFPEKSVSFEACWNAYVHTNTSDGSPSLSNTWSSIRRAIYTVADALGVQIEHRTDLIVPVQDVERWSGAWWQWFPIADWSQRLEAWLSAGWVAIAEISYEPKPAVDLDGNSSWIDHVVVLDGVRQGWMGEGDVRSWQYEIHVVCSKAGPHWVNARKLLRLHGAAGLQLVRRRA